MKKNILITNIQRFSLHDGPGIRTTVFLKGCSIRCPWCSNPENLVALPQNYVENGIEKTYGIYMSHEDLYKEIMKDFQFYNIVQEKERQSYRISSYNEWNQLPGGVTFSGGEALTQIDELEPLLKKLNNENVHTTLETSLFVDEYSVEKALSYFDLFYVDMKILKKNRCQEILGGNLKLYEDNLKRLIDSKKPVIIRIPVICGYTDDAENISLILNMLYRMASSIIMVEIIKGHRLGTSKYESMGYAVPNFEDVTDDFLKKFKDKIESLGIVTEICKI
ncbi:MAG: radical SAM protein [Lachnospiraceae bacterium]|nr:radical SAM protein [Lachnospiraceae bacterium]